MTSKSNKFEKQASGFNLLNLDVSPNYRPFELPIKDCNDQYSFTLKSRDDLFNNNQGFADYSFSNIELKNDKDAYKSPSPMTRRQRAKEIEKIKDTLKHSSPERFKIDWDKIQFCPCCRQKMPQDKTQINRDFFSSRFDSLMNRSQDSPNKNDAKKSKFRKHSQTNGAKGRDDSKSESDDSEYKILSKSKPKTADSVDADANKRRKSKAQVKLLEEELEANPHWTNEDMVKIAKKTGLTKSQVYKWNWDQKKKKNLLPRKVYVVQLPESYFVKNPPK